MEKAQWDTLVSKINELCDARSGRNTDKDVLNSRDVMQIMNVSKRTLQDWRDEGKITFTQIGKVILYQKEAIKEMLDRHKVHGKARL